MATSRDEVPSAAGELILRLTRNHHAHHLPLERLGPDQVAEMVLACVPAADDDVIARVGRTSDGVPFLVEEVLASPGVPDSFHDSVRTRLADFPDAERLVLSTAAVLGRHFDWNLLVDAVDQPADVVTRALERGVDHQLLRFDGHRFSFRHALTREAILERLLPPRRRGLAAAALSALDATPGPLDGTRRDLAADLALQSGDDRRAAGLLIASGRSAIERGALPTAIDNLGRAHALGRPEAGPILVETLALAGRVDEAVATGATVIARLDDPREGAELHLLVAQDAVAAARWELATRHLAAARQLLAAAAAGAGTGGTADGDVAARSTALEAEVALAADEVDRARQLATEALSSAPTSPEVRCHAHEILGRLDRLSDLGAARAHFEHARSIAHDGDLALWQVRKMHQLGTIDMFDHAGTERLGVARRMADDLGALSTAAVVDLQLAAVSHSRFELDPAAAHARSALVLGEKLALGQVRAKALAMLAENSAWRGDREEMEHYIGMAAAASPGDLMLAAFAWGSRGMRELLHGERLIAVGHLGRATAVLGAMPHAEPACFRTVWPVPLASVGDPRATGEVIEARRLGVGAFRLNSGLLTHAEAILTGRAGDPMAARRLAGSSESGFVNCTAWVGGARPWAGLGITAREGDVLDLVVEGLANKEIAAALCLSPRTVEKHVEALLRKLGARSRTHLAAVAGARDRPATT